MRCTPVEPKQIEKAKKDALYIVQFCVTGQYRTPKDGGFAVTGAFSKEAAKEFLTFARDWYKRNSD